MFSDASSDFDAEMRREDPWRARSPQKLLQVFMWKLAALTVPRMGKIDKGLVLSSKPQHRDPLLKPHADNGHVW